MVPSFSGFPRSSCFFLLLPALLARCFWPVDFISCTDRMPEPRFIEAASNVQFFTAVSRFSPSRCILGDFSCKTCPQFRVSRRISTGFSGAFTFPPGRVCVLCRSPPVKLHLKKPDKRPTKKQTARGLLALVQAYHGQGIFTRIFHRRILRPTDYFSGLLAILPPFLG